MQGEAKHTGENTMKVNEDKNSAIQPAQTDGAVSATQPPESIAFKAGREAREQGIPITQSALRAIRPGCQQYYDFIDGYDSAK